LLKILLAAMDGGFFLKKLGCAISDNVPASRRRRAVCRIYIEQIKRSTDLQLLRNFSKTGQATERSEAVSPLLCAGRGNPFQ